jgi:hypothetical protein
VVLPLASLDGIFRSRLRSASSLSSPGPPRVRASRTRLDASGLYLWLSGSVHDWHGRVAVAVPGSLRGSVPGLGVS